MFTLGTTLSISLPLISVSNIDSIFLSFLFFSLCISEHFNDNIIRISFSSSRKSSSSGDDDRAFHQCKISSSSDRNDFLVVLQEHRTTTDDDKENAPVKTRRKGGKPRNRFRTTSIDRSIGGKFSVGFSSV